MIGGMYSPGNPGQPISGTGVMYYGPPGVTRPVGIALTPGAVTGGGPDGSDGDGSGACVPGSMGPLPEAGGCPDPGTDSSGNCGECMNSGSPGGNWRTTGYASGTSTIVDLSGNKTVTNWTDTNGATGNGIFDGAKAYLELEATFSVTFVWRGPGAPPDCISGILTVGVVSKYGPPNSGSVQGGLGGDVVDDGAGTLTQLGSIPFTIKVGASISYSAKAIATGPPSSGPCEVAINGSFSPLP